MAKKNESAIMIIAIDENINEQVKALVNIDAIKGMIAMLGWSNSDIKQIIEKYKGDLDKAAMHVAHYVFSQQSKLSEWRQKRATDDDYMEPKPQVDETFISCIKVASPKHSNNAKANGDISRMKNVATTWNKDDNAERVCVMTSKSTGRSIRINAEDIERLQVNEGQPLDSLGMGTLDDQLLTNGEKHCPQNAWMSAIRKWLINDITFAFTEGQCSGYVTRAKDRTDWEKRYNS